MLFPILGYSLQDRGNSRKFRADALYLFHEFRGAVLFLIEIGQQVLPTIFLRSRNLGDNRYFTSEKSYLFGDPLGMLGLI